MVERDVVDFLDFTATLKFQSSGIGERATNALKDSVELEENAVRSLEKAQGVEDDLNKLVDDIQKLNRTTGDMLETVSWAEK